MRASDRSATFGPTLASYLLKVIVKIFRSSENWAATELTGQPEPLYLMSLTKMPDGGGSAFDESSIGAAEAKAARKRGMLLENFMLRIVAGRVIVVLLENRKD